MNNLNKKIFIFIGILLVSILLVAIVYNNHIRNKTIQEFITYLDNYKQETSTYNLTDMKEEYENKIEQYEQAIDNKDYKNIEVLKSDLENLKQELLAINLELSNKSITELESIDISILDNKEDILSKIEDIKLLREQHQFIKINENFKVLKDEVTAKLEVLNKNKIDSIYKNFDGYWIGNLDNVANIRIDLNNNTFTGVVLVTQGQYPIIDTWEYDEVNNLYELICSYKTDNPFMPIGKEIIYKVKYINDKQIELNGIPLYKVSYEQAVYYQLYLELAYSKDTKFTINPNSELNLLSAYTVNSEEPMSVISQEKAKGIILDKVYSKELIEYNKKAANAFEIDFDIKSQISVFENQLAPNIKYYYFDAITLILPLDYKEGTILGSGYYDDRCFSNGFVLTNGIVIESTDLGEPKLESLKNEILTYYN